MPQSVLDKAFDDMVQAIEDSHVTTADLSAVAGGEATFQSDESALNAQRTGLAFSGPPIIQIFGGVGTSGTNINVTATTLRSGSSSAVAQEHARHRLHG